MKSRWRRDILDAQQLGLPRTAGLILVVALLSATTVPAPYGFIICAGMLALLALLLHQNTRRRRRGIDGWSNSMILAPFVLMSLVVLIGTLVSELAAALFTLAVIVVGSVRLVRRFRRTDAQERSAHYFRGVASPNDP